MTAPAIETHGLTNAYGDLRAVSDLDLRVERGEVFGYLGRGVLVVAAAAVAALAAGSVLVERRDLQVP